MCASRAPESPPSFRGPPVGDSGSRGSLSMVYFYTKLLISYFLSCQARPVSAV